MGFRELPSPLPLSRPRGRGVPKAGRGPAPQGSRPGLIYFAPTGLQHRSPSQLNFIDELLRQEASRYTAHSRRYTGNPVFPSASSCANGFFAQYAVYRLPSFLPFPIFPFPALALGTVGTGFNLPFASPLYILCAYDNRRCERLTTIRIVKNRKRLCQE